MAKTEQVYFSGKGYWAKLVHPDIEYNNWNIKLYFDEPSLSLFEQLQKEEDGVAGILNEVKMDDEGKYHVFKRPVSKNFGNGDERLTPPVVLDASGQPFQGGIGNGSDVTVKCELYRYNNRRTKKPGRAIRLEGVKINSLVPYEKKDMLPEQQKLAAGLDERPAPPTW